MTLTWLGGADGLQGFWLGLADALRVADVLLNKLLRIDHAELLVQEIQLLFELTANCSPRCLRQRPDLLLERAPYLLARLVDELLLRVALGPLIGEFFAY